MANTLRASTSVALHSLSRANETYGERAGHLSSGQRVNSGSEDPAGLILSSRLTTNSRFLSQGTRNANDAISSISVADAAVEAQQQVLSRLQELASQSSNSTVTSSQRTALQSEYTSMLSEFNRISTSAQFNGTKVLASTDGSSPALLSVQIGADGATGNQITVTLADTRATSTVWDALQPVVSTVTQTASQASTIVTNYINTYGSGIVNWTYAEVQAFVGSGTCSVIVPGLHNGQTRDILVVGMGRASATSIQTMQFERSLSDPTKWTNYIVPMDILRFVSANNSGVGDISYDSSGNLTADSLSGTTLDFGTLVQAAGTFVNLRTSSISTQTKAQSAVTTISTALNSLSNIRGTLAANLSRISTSLQHARDLSANSEAAASRILDIDTASEISGLLKSQILVQQSTAVLASINQDRARVETLLAA